MSQEEIDFMEQYQRAAQKIAKAFDISLQVVRQEARIVEGTIIEPISDEKRLLS